MKKSSRMFFVLLIALIFSVGAYAFAAANTVPDTVAGDGAGTISGVKITDVHYNISTANPAKITSVDLTTEAPIPAGVDIQIKLVSAGSTWYSCTYTGTSVSCTTTGADVVAADQLRVLASS